MYPYGSDPSYEMFARAADARLQQGEVELSVQDLSNAYEQVMVQHQEISNNRWDEDRYRPGDRHRPPSGGHRLPIGGQRPPHRPPHRPPEGGFRPPGGGHRPPHGGNRPPGGHGYPTGAPPLFIPRESAALHSIDARAISRCMNDFTYVWLVGGNGFWMFPTFVGPRSIAGYRWGRFGWTYTGFDIRAIKAFSC